MYYVLVEHLGLTIDGALYSEVRGQKHQFGAWNVALEVGMKDFPLSFCRLDFNGE